MNTRKIKLFVLSLALISLITACGGDKTAGVAATNAPAKSASTMAAPTTSASTMAASTTSAPTTATTVAAPTVAAATVATATVEVKTGFITGHVQLMSPPTPVMFVYALDSATGVWVMVQTQPADGPVSFTLEVPPGSYQVFAAAEGWPTVGVGYSQDSLTLTQVTVAAGQTVADIIVRSPSQGDCGQMPGYPASPDGRFAAVPGPSADCTARPAAGDTYSPVSLTVCETLQEIATHTLGVPFPMELNADFVDYLSGERGHGCSLTATGTGADFSDPVTVLTDLVNAFVGWTEQPDYQANGPTGAATGLTRDMGLMLVSAEWTPAPGVQCPSDQPISACNLTPEQKHYTVQIQVAQK